MSLHQRHATRSASSIAIIGAGFSGTVLALHLLARCPRDTRVYLIERGRRFGNGLAYSTDSPSHLLNVPAGRMSAFEDRPDHFLDWLRRQSCDALQDTAVNEMTFAPRALFGAYVRHLLDGELQGLGTDWRLALVHSEAVAMETTSRGIRIRLDRHQNLDVDLAVLALGNFPPEPPRVAEASFYDSACYRSDPWATNTLSHLDRAAPVLLIGTGLTMVDMALSLLDQGHVGSIYALSRHGLLPRRHAFDGTWQPFPEAPFPASVRMLTRRVRAEVERAASYGVGWQAVVNALRPVIQSLWWALPYEERARFLRHLRPWWDVHRHRLAPRIANRIERAQRSGQLVVRAGRIRGCRIDGGEAVVEFSQRGAQATETLRVQRVINCSGPTSDYARIRHPLVTSLLAQGAGATGPAAPGAGRG